MKKRLLIAFVLILLPLSAQAKIFLADTDDTLRVVTASGVSTIHMYAAWADITTTALTPGASDAQVTTATTTVLVAAPGASTQRQLKGLTIANSHASSSNVVTVEFFDGATATRLIAYTLLAGETLQWNEDVGFRVLDANGQLKGAVVADTELPTAQSLAGNNIAYPTLAPIVGAVILCDDGAALDKCQGGLTENDDNSVAQGTAGHSTVINIPYVNNGTNWERLRKFVYAEDSAHSSGDTGAFTLSVRADTAASSASTDGEYAALITDSLGRLWTRVGGDVNVTATNLDVQSGGSDLATSTQAAAIQTAVELIDNAVSGAGFNISRMGGTDLSMGAGSHGSGSQRVSVAGPCTDPARITSAVIDESTAATNQIVGLNGSDLIYVCSYKVVTTAASSLSWKYGTGTDCATGLTAIEGPQPYGAGVGVTESGGGAPLFIVPAGNALCLTSSAATAHGGRVTYVRTANP